MRFKKENVIIVARNARLEGNSIRLITEKHTHEAIFVSEHKAETAFEQLLRDGWIDLEEFEASSRIIY